MADSVKALGLTSAVAVLIASCDAGKGSENVLREAAAGADLASFLRNKPRATRKVPLDCSMLIGLVRTRFAPIRKALATPACPSTTATESEL